MILERWDRKKEDPAQLGLFLLAASALWLLTCLYPAASPLALVWYFLLWRKGFLLINRFSLQTSWRRDSKPLSSDWMVHNALSPQHAAGCSSKYDLIEGNMPSKLLPRSLEAGEICTYMLLLKDFVMQNMQSINCYPFLEPLLNSKLALRKRQWEISPPFLPPPVQCLYSVFSSSLCLTGILVF